MTSQQAFEAIQAAKHPSEFAPALGAALAVVIVLVAATVPTQGVPPFIYFAF